ncbi:MAG: hypothetical protein PWQ28_355 [Candidatus Woesearchaeota archaeon]|nr:hypothetical protein [Candidatus Woesearchaeota archaeon]MDK2908119.1 hypothetical protein [Candidatus Woesearchaeota archaeon]
MNSNMLIKRILDSKNSMLNYNSNEFFSRLIESSDGKTELIEKHLVEELMPDLTKELLIAKSNQRGQNGKE